MMIIYQKQRKIVLSKLKNIKHRRSRIIDIRDFIHEQLWMISSNQSWSETTKQQVFMNTIIENCMFNIKKILF